MQGGWWRRRVQGGWSPSRAVTGSTHHARRRSWFPFTLSVQACLLTSETDHEHFSTEILVVGSSQHMGEWWPGGPTVGLPTDGEEEESIISVRAFERLSDAAKAKYMAARPGSAERLQSMSPPRHGEISASPRSRAPAIESPPFEPRKNWLSQQVQGYSTTLQDNGASPTAVAYDTDEHLRRKEPRVLSAPSRTKSPTVQPDDAPRTFLLVSNDAPASPEAVRSALEQALALELETCKPVSNELFAGLRVQNVKNGAAARAHAVHQLKVGDVILSVQDYRVDGISPKLLADAISSFATPSVLTVNSSLSALRLVLQRPCGINQQGGRKWEHREVTIPPVADTPYMMQTLPKHDPVPFRTCAARAHFLLILERASE